MITEMFTTKEQIQDFLKECNVSDYEIQDDLAVSIYDGVLEIDNKEIKLIPFRLKYVKRIYIKNTLIESLENLPDRLEKIVVVDTPLKSTNGLPRTLEHFEIDGTKVTYFENLPQRLEKIVVKNSPLESTNGLPTNMLEHFEVDGVRLEYLENLPSGLKFLSVSNCPLKSTKGIPRSVRYLNFYETEVECIEDIPEQLERLSSVQR